MSAVRLRLKQASGWFAAGREIEAALRVLSDAAFKLFIWLCLHAERSRGCMATSTARMACALGTSEQHVAAALDELLHKGVCRRLDAGRVEITDRFWPYIRLPHPAALPDSVAYIERIKQAFLSRSCVRSVFTPADAKLAAQLHHNRVPLECVERAILLGCIRKYVALVNNNGGTPITALNYFNGLIEEVRRTEVSPAYWHYISLKISKIEQRWSRMERFCIG
jgi:hypothetical protein